MSAKEYYKSLSIEKTKELTLFGFAEAYHKSENEKEIALLKKFTIGFKWNMENKPETLDKADYEFYDEVKSLLNQN